MFVVTVEYTDTVLYKKRNGKERASIIFRQNTIVGKEKRVRFDPEEMMHRGTAIFK